MIILQKIVIQIVIIQVIQLKNHINFYYKIW